MPAISASFLPDHHGIDAIVATKEMSPDRSTIEIESPSTPTKYSMLNERIQTKCAESCTPVCAGSYICHAASAATSETPLATSATTRDAWSENDFGRPAKKRTARSTVMTTAPASGAKVARLRTLLGVNISRGSPWLLDEEVEQDQHERAAERAVEVGLDASGLDVPPRLAGVPRQGGERVHGAVDEVLV